MSGKILRRMLPGKIDNRACRRVLKRKRASAYVSHVGRPVLKQPRNISGSMVAQISGARWRAAQGDWRRPRSGRPDERGQ